MTKVFKNLYKNLIERTKYDMYKYIKHHIKLYIPIKIRNPKIFPKPQKKLKTKTISFDGTTPYKSSKNGILTSFHSSRERFIFIYTVLFFD